MPRQSWSSPGPTLCPTCALAWSPQVQEAMALYQMCVREANARQQDLEAAKQRIVSHVRKLVLQGDEVLRRVRPFPTATPHSPLAPVEGPLPLTHPQGLGLLPRRPVSTLGP